MERAESESVGPAPALLDIREVAQLLDVSPRHVYRLVDAGKMPSPLRLGAAVRFSKKALTDWIAAGCPAVGKGGPKA